MSRFESNPWSLERSLREFQEEFLDLMRVVSAPGWTASSKRKTERKSRPQSDCAESGWTWPVPDMAGNKIPFVCIHLKMDVELLFLVG